MRKKVGLLFLITFLLIIGPVYYLSLYESSVELNGFPVPKSAEMIEELESGHSYHWSKASEENGIPLGYELVIKANGWTKGKREGSYVTYTKGNQEINLFTQTEHLKVINNN
ncbi:hypothetical protein [Alkalibacillus aidingensis]|uniref:hypothetical protein n=1 Tax=Alkalibacillus aidingensis TaxID=2747607 RepID=UPI00166170CA|nr:hypothetical protein [Alkalibacillus aidingensis]